MNSDRNTANANNEHKKVRKNLKTARTAILNQPTEANRTK